MQPLISRTKIHSRSCEMARCRWNSVQMPPRRVCAASDGLVCEVCGSGDCATTLLHCDGCEVGAAHADCAFLSDSDVPGGAWFCPACGGPPYVDLACQRKPKKKKRRVDHS